jgi:GH15 family glucan-1,4-alpha-glucosidase
MAWVAFDRAAMAVESEGHKDPARRWRQIADEIYAEVCERGFDRDLNSFVQAYGSKRLDASLLLLPLVGFLPAADPRIKGTLAAIEDRLLIDNEFVLRYETENPGDGLPAGEGATYYRAVTPKPGSSSIVCSHAAMTWDCLLKSSIR